MTNYKNAFFWTLGIAKKLKIENDIVFKLLTKDKKEEFLMESGKLVRDNIIKEVTKDCDTFFPKEKTEKYNYKETENIMVLPKIMLEMKFFLQEKKTKLCEENVDGRTNSCIDEDRIIKDLIERFGDKISVPNIRMWYDILVRDEKFGWIPVNIKTTTTKTSDNVGNLSICVQAYTDEVLKLDKAYNNGEMSKILVEKLKNKKYNKTPGKDYYFLVVNKNSGEVICNSVLGLSKLTPNNNNLPFQVKWSNNKVYKSKNIEKAVSMFIRTVQKPKPNWSETFLEEIRKI